jgi:son of sevenless-like protein
MSSIVAALSSVLISRLHFTWLNSNKELSLEPLRKVIHPASNYGHYRGILEAIEGPCVPFVGPFLKNIVYAQEQHADNVVVQSGTQPDQAIYSYPLRKATEVVRDHVANASLSGKTISHP